MQDMPADEDGNSMESLNFHAAFCFQFDRSKTSYWLNKHELEKGEILIVNWNLNGAGTKYWKAVQVIEEVRKEKGRCPDIIML